MTDRERQPHMPETPSLPDSRQPPSSIEELRALMLAIARSESEIVLGRKTREALDRILELQGSPVVLSITTLAEELGVNPSTLTRLAQTLGYRGFGAFQQVLLSAQFARPAAFYTRQAQAALSGSEGGSRAAVERLCHENQANITKFLEGFDAKSFDAAVGHIAEARRVVVFGKRQFHSFAAFLAYGLRMVRSDVALLDGLGVAEELATLAKGDVLIAASCAPYTAVVVETTRVAKERGLTVIAVTDRASSPLINASDAALLVPHDTSFLSNSMTAFIACAECLINACAAQLGERAAAALADRDALITRLKIEI
jgi:DNA-binding MurR/RpiR family transcriptional regulator